MKSKLNVLAVTGIRSEYDILYPVLDELKKRGHRVQVLVSGAHLSELHGRTERKILEDGFDIADRVDSLLSTDRTVQRSKGVGLLIQGLSQTVERSKPDFLVVVGDREESIAAAIVGNYTETLVAHLGGGDPVFGNADDPIRFAVSKLAHLHCCTAKAYADNLIRVGEEEFRVFWTGNTSYVNIDRVNRINLVDLAAQLNLEISDGKYVVLIKHPLSSEVGEASEQIRITLVGLEMFCAANGYRVVCIPPNSDPGSQTIREWINSYRDKPWFYAVETLPREQFVNLMRYARALVGNSSMGILEAPHYRLPVINIGNRQKGRLNAGNVRFVDYVPEQIAREVGKACLDEKYRNSLKNMSNPYGDGTAARKVCDAMEAVDLKDRKWYIKQRLCP